MGIQGRLVYTKKNVNIYRKPILPLSNGASSEAIAIVYRGVYGTPNQVSFTPKSLGISKKGVTNYEVIDVFDNKSLGIVNTDQTISVKVNPTGKLVIIHLLKLTSIKRRSTITKKTPKFGAGAI